MDADRGRTSNDADKSVFSLDDEYWPTVDASTIADPGHRARYERLRRGVDLRRGGHPLRVAAKASGMGKKAFARLLGKCRAMAADGRPAGYRALVFGWHAHERERHAPFQPGKTLSAGFSGLFGKLLRDRPALEKLIVERLRRRGEKGMQVNRLVGRNLRNLLVQACLELGMGHSDYPLNTRDRGLRALRRWIVHTFLPKYAREWTKHQHGPTAAAILSDRPTETPTPTDPLDDWIIDEVKVDLRAKYELVGMYGDIDGVELERFIELRVIHGGTGATMANHLVLAPQAAAADVGRLFYKAVSGSPRLELTVPGLEYDPGAGYPADCVEGMRYRAPRRIYLDNALAHLAAHTQYVAEATLGARFVLGRPAYPIARGAVESSFANEARRVTHQLPGTTGSGPSEKTKSHRKLPVESLVRADELAQVLDVYQANVNAAPHSASNGYAPLEQLRRLHTASRLRGELIPVEHRRPHMFSAPLKVMVRSELPRGRKPFIIFKKVRYSSQLLQRRFDLVDHPMWLRVDTDDLRVVVLFHPDGTELGAVRAVGRWGTQPHDVRIRNMFMKLIDNAQYDRMPQDGPVHALLAHLQAGASDNRKTALQYSYVMEYLKRQIGGAMATPQNEEAYTPMPAAEPIGVISEPAGNDASASPAVVAAPPPAAPTSTAGTVVPMMTPRRAIRR